MVVDTPPVIEIKEPETEFQLTEYLFSLEEQYEFEEASNEFYELVPLEESREYVLMPYKTYAGHYELTAYCTGSICADGNPPVVEYTVACNDPKLWNKWIYIEGIGERYVHDTGGMSSNIIDIYVGSYSEAIQFGRQSADIYIIEGR